MREKLMYKGIPASTGIAIGRAFVLPPWDWDIPEKNIDVGDLAKEFERLSESIRTSKHEIRHIKEEMNGTAASHEKDIFDAHLAILDDPVFMQEVKGIIQRQYKAAEVAVKEVIDHFVEMFSVLDDQYMKERALDIKDVGQRLLHHLLGTPAIELPQDNNPFILVAPELSPSQLTHLNPSHVLGILTLAGGKTSHTAIMARAMGIPLVIGWEDMFESPVQTGDLLVLDGEDGSLYINPSQEIIQEYRKKHLNWLKQRDALKTIVDHPAITLDGLEVILKANITSEKEISSAYEYGAEGIGLFRTEYLYMDRHDLPSEAEQERVYLELAEQSKGKPVIIRTLDIGADKKIDYLAFPEEENPALGYRAIRISLDKKEIFRTQLRAILKASIHHNVKILYPMITSVQELEEANAVLEEVKSELDEQGVLFDRNIPIGIMIEVPAAALIADILAKKVDFFSIGTNDLIQYTLAADRLNEQIAHLYDPYHPAVLRMLRFVVDSAHKEGIGVGVCGEMAGDLRAIPIWLGLGVQKLSMSVQSLLPIKRRILDMEASKCKACFEQLIQCSTSDEVKEQLNLFSK